MAIQTLVIDNFDSFVFNLVQYIGELGGNPVVFRNNEITLEQAQKLNPSHIVISPGPGNPIEKEYFGVCSEIISQMGKKTPLLGVCLGHQGIALSFGGSIENASEIQHGKSSWINHSQSDIFQGLPSPIQAMRYHSLIVKKEDFPNALQISAETKEGSIMALQHRAFPIYGIQFHPESIGTPEGKQILRNFLRIQI